MESLWEDANISTLHTSYRWFVCARERNERVLAAEPEAARVKATNTRLSSTVCGRGSRLDALVHPAAPATVCSLPALPVRLLRPLRVPPAYLLPHPIPASRSSRRYLLAVTALPYRGWVRPSGRLSIRGRPRRGPPRRRRSTARRPPHPGAGRDNHRKILPKEWFYFPNIPYGKGGFDGSGGGGVSCHRVSSL